MDADEDLETAESAPPLPPLQQLPESMEETEEPDEEEEEEEEESADGELQGGEIIILEGEVGVGSAAKDGNVGVVTEDALRR